MDVEKDVEKTEGCFTATETWRESRILFLFGRFFGASYITKANDKLKIILQFYCGITGIFQIVYIGVVFSYLGEAPILSGPTFTTLLVGAYVVFCLLNWAFALYIQSYIPKIYQMYQRLRERGYGSDAKIHVMVIGICGFTVTMMIIDGILNALGATGHIKFPRDTNFLKIHVLNGIAMAWSTVDV